MCLKNRLIRIQTGKCRQIFKGFLLSELALHFIVLSLYVRLKFKSGAMNTIYVHVNVKYSYVKLFIKLAL